MATVAIEPAEKVVSDQDVQVPYRFTADQVLKMVEAEILPEDKSTELLNGVLYQVTKYETHNLIVGQLGDLVRPLIPAGFHLREEKSSRGNEKSMPEPDLAVCRGTRKDYWPDLPTLDKFAAVVEISHHSETSDRVIKFALYAAAGVPCYWIVNVGMRTVEVWTRPASAEGESARYEMLVTYKPGQSIPVVIDGQPRGGVNVADIFPPEKPS